MITGTCVVAIVMLDTFWPGTLPGDTPRVYTRSDIATFNDIYDVALSLSSRCVRRKGEAEAGWSSTGKSACYSLQSSNREHQRVLRLLFGSR